MFICFVLFFTVSEEMVANAKLKGRIGCEVLPEHCFVVAKVFQVVDIMFWVVVRLSLSSPHVPDVDRIWADTMLLSGQGFPRLLLGY